MQKGKSVIDSSIQWFQFLNTRKALFIMTYIKVFSGVAVSYLMVSTNDVLNNNNIDTTFPELRKFFQ